MAAGVAFLGAITLYLLRWNAPRRGGPDEPAPVCETPAGPPPY